jgi:hypothetical protein
MNVNYVERITENCLRKILGSDETIAKKTTYLAETLETVIRMQIIEEVEESFAALGREVEIEQMNAQSRTEKESYGVALESLDSVRQAVINRLR